MATAIFVSDSGYVVEDEVAKAATDAKVVNTVVANGEVVANAATADDVGRATDGTIDRVLLCVGSGAPAGAATVLDRFLLG